MSTHTRRLIIVVDADTAAVANARAAELDVAGGAQTFTVGLSPSGNPPATAYWCSWQMTPGWDSGIRTRLQNAINANKARVYDGLTTTPEQVLAALGLRRLGEAV